MFDRREFLQKAGLIAAGAAAGGAVARPGRAEAEVSPQAKTPEVRLKELETGLSGVLERLSLLETKTRIDAATQYGASTLSRNPNYWQMGLKYAADRVFAAKYQSPGGIEGVHTRLSTGGPNIVDGYVMLRHVPGSISFFKGKERAMGLLVDGRVVPQIDVQGATVWSGVENVKLLDERLPEHFQELVKVEKTAQPGAIMVPVGFAPECVVPVKVEHVTTPEAAAKLYGDDDYSKNPANWILSYEKDDNGTTAMRLKDRKVGEEHSRIKNLEGKVADGYIEVRDDREIPFSNKYGERPIAFLADGTVVPTLDVKGVTIWDIREKGKPMARAKALNNHWAELVAEEAVKQPGILILPFGFNPNTLVCK